MPIWLALVLHKTLCCQKWAFEGKWGWAVLVLASCLVDGAVSCMSFEPDAATWHQGDGREILQLAARGVVGSIKGEVEFLMQHDEGEQGLLHGKAPADALAGAHAKGGKGGGVPGLGPQRMP